MTSASRKLQLILMGTAVVVGLGLSAPAGAEELRIGYLAPLTGGLAQTGIDMRDGFLLYLEQHGNKLGGMDVKLIIEDEQGKGDVAVTKAKKLVLQDKVHMLIGGVLASTGYALAPVSTELKTMYIPSIPAADDLTQRQLKNFPYLIRTSWSSSQPHHPLGQWACDQGYKKVVDDRGGLRLRLRGRWRLPEGVRGLRRPDRPEDLASAWRQGFRAIHPDDQGGHRRGILADGGPDAGTIHQANARRRLQEADPRRRHQL